MLASRRRILSLAASLAAAHLLAPRSAWAHGALRRTSVGDLAEFLRAVSAGELESVRRLLAADAGLARATDEQGRSAYVLAHLAGHADVAGLLREQGFELDLVESVLARDWERVVALAEAHPEQVNALHPIGGTPLHAAALCGVPDLYRVRAIGCDPDGNPAGGLGFTPPRAALECRDPIDARVTATDLLGNGSDVNAPQRDGDSVLHAAVRRRDPLLVRLALRKGGDVSARDVEGRTPLELAGTLGWDEGQALLRDHRSVARDHRTSRYACDASRGPVEPVALDDVPQALQSEVTGSSHARLERVRELLEQDPRLVWSVSTDAELAIEACGHTGNRDIIRLHLDHGAPLSLPTAISLGDADHARFLLDQDPLRVHERGPHDFALMWYPAIAGGSVELAELLLERGTPVDQDSVGLTCLHWAARRGQADLARLLIERGADVNAVGHVWDRAGQTPLALALENDRGAVAGVLREAGARA